MDKTINPRNDLTNGPILKKLLVFAIPTIAGNLVMQLYNVVDSIIVGNFAPNGTNALAAVGVSFPIMFLFNALFMGIAMGAQIVISQNFGAKDFDSLRKSLNTAMTLAFGMGLLITIIGAPLAKPILVMLKTPVEILDDAVTYLVVIFLGMLGNVYYMLGSGALRGMGDSRWPLIALIVSAVLNIVLDLLFVIVFNWGVFGVALATSIAHLVSGIMLAWRIERGGYPARIELKLLLKPDKIATRNILRLGLPSGLQQVAISLGSLVIQSFANQFGPELIAANTIIMKADGFAVMPMFGLSAAATTFVGQNIGAGNVERARKGIYYSVATVAVMTAVIGAVLWVAGQQIMMAFNADGDVLTMGVRGIRFLAFFYLFMGIELTIGGSLRGAGAAIAPMVTSITANLVRIPIVFVIAVLPLQKSITELLARVPQPADLLSLSNKLNASGLYESFEAAKFSAASTIAGASHYMGMYYAMGATMVFGAVISFIYFKFGKWHSKGIHHRL